jgi:hypothetical protein
VQIDTIKAGERKIDYPATGHVSLTSSSERHHGE